MVSTFLLLAASMVVGQEGMARLRPIDVPSLADMEAFGGTFLIKGQCPSWSPDGTRLVFCLSADFEGSSRKQGIGILHIESGTVTQLTEHGQAPVWSPGQGKWIAYVVTDAEEPEIWMVDPDGGQSRKVCLGRLPCWGVDGNTLYFYSDATKALMEIDVTSKPEEPKRVLDIPHGLPAVSPDGTRVAYRSGAWLHIVNRETRQLVTRYVLPGGEGLLPGAFSPDGNYLAVAGGTAADIRGLWILDVATGHAVRLTDGPFNMPAWSKDGSQLAFVLSSASSPEVWMITCSVLDRMKLKGISLQDYVPPQDGDVEVLSKFLSAMTERKAAAKSEYDRWTASVRADYSEELSRISLAQAEVATRIIELESDRTSDAYISAFTIAYPSKLKELALLGEAEQRAFVEDIKNLFQTKGAKELTRNDVMIARSVAGTLANAGSTELALTAYREFSAALAKSTDPYVLSYRSRYLDAEANKLAIIGTPMQLVGTKVRNDGAFDWNSYRGKFVLVDFWATWCAPCRAELPNMKRCYEAYKDSGFTIVGVSLDRDRAALEKYLEDMDVPWVNLHEKDGNGTHPAATHYEVRSIPTMYLVDREGKIVSTSARGSQLVSLLAENLGPSEELAQKAALSGDWERAARLAELATIASPTDIEAWNALAVAQLLTGDQQGYESTCRTALARFAKNDNPHIRAKVVRLCALAPNASLQQATLSDVAKSLPEDYNPNRRNLICGMLDYRLGRFANVLAELTAKGDSLQVPLAMLIRAMASEQSGQLDEAKQLYRLACMEVAKRVPSPQGEPLADYMPARWVVWGMIEVVRRQADQLISGATAGSHERVLHLVTTGNLSKAVDELSKMIEQSPNDPNLRKLHCDLAVRAGNWRIAADDLAMAIEDDPSDSIDWLRTATMLARAGDADAHADFCKRMADRFGEDRNISAVEQTIKSSLLLAGSADVGALPVSRLRELLEKNQVAASFAPWGWATCALAEFRRGDLDALLQVVKKAEAATEYEENVRVQIMVLFFKSLALHERGETEDAQAAYDRAENLLGERLALHEANGTWHHDDLIALILKDEIDDRREAKK
jgi:thioredoxin-like negative regulator of GroEL